MANSNPKTQGVNPYAAPQVELQTPFSASSPAREAGRFNWKLALAAWLLFFGGLALLLAIEYVFRKQQQKNDVAIPEKIALPIISMLGMASLFCSWKATSSRQHWFLRIAIVSIQGGLAFVLYGLLIISYWLLSDLPLRII